MQNKETLPVGTILNSDERTYHIKSVLGQGGFGITYLATATIQVGNIPVEMQFAIKEHYISSMNEREGASVSVSNENNTEEIKESIDSFIVEAQRLNKLSLNHPGIVRVNESFRANGTAYYVMEYIKGQSLREYVKHSAQGRLSEDKALQLFKPIAETIGYLHDNKLTHLDIKPDNILVRENGQPVVIDFGLSKHYDKKGTPTSTIKAAGCSAGYSPMEQYVGITTFTPEADIYALAATLLYMLTGKDPIVATDMKPEFIANSLADKASPSTFSAITHAMEKLKENRTPSISRLLSEIQDETSEEKVAEEKSQPIVNRTKKIEYGEVGRKKEKRIERSLWLIAILCFVLFFFVENIIFIWLVIIFGVLSIPLSIYFALKRKAKVEIIVGIASLIICIGIFSYHYYSPDNESKPVDNRVNVLKNAEDPKLENIIDLPSSPVTNESASSSESYTEKKELEPANTEETSRDLKAEQFQKAIDTEDWAQMRALAKLGYRPACGALARHYVSLPVSTENSCRAWHWAQCSSKADRMYVVNELKKTPFFDDNGNPVPECDNIIY